MPVSILTEFHNDVEHKKRASYLRYTHAMVIINMMVNAVNIKNMAMFNAFCSYVRSRLCVPEVGNKTLITFCLKDSVQHMHAIYHSLQLTYCGKYSVLERIFRI